jgi:adenine phosphoribosyltransferase
MDFRSLIRDVPDFPKPGILFRDITPLLGDPRALTEVTDLLAHRYAEVGIDKIVAIESRGFLFAAPLACRLGVGLVPARKPGKLPFESIEETYELEYGANAICLHVDAVKKGERVLVLDDLIATGGTLAATCRLVERLGAEIVEVATIIELTALEGRKVLGNRPFYTLIQY